MRYVKVSNVTFGWQTAHFVSEVLGFENVSLKKLANTDGYKNKFTNI